jgi:Na+/melibiose symporter-like transporter
MALCIVMPLLVLNAAWFVPEFPIVETRAQKLPLRETMRYVFRNRPYLRLIIVFAFVSLGAAMTNSLSFFFVKHVLQAGDLYGFYLSPYFVAQIVAIPLWFKLSRKVGKHRATMVAIGWYAAWSCLIPIIAIARVSGSTRSRWRCCSRSCRKPGTRARSPTSKASKPASSSSSCW